MARGGLPAAPNSNPRLPRAIAYCRPKMVLTMGSTLLRGLHGRPEVAVQVSTDDIVLGLDTAIPLGLIANELILNCFKHAFPGGRSGLVNVSIEYLGDSVKRGEPCACVCSMTWSASLPGWR